MVYIIHEILVLLKKSLELSERYFFQMLFKKYHASKKIFFSYHIMMKNPRPDEEKIIKDIRNLVSLFSKVAGQQTASLL